MTFAAERSNDVEDSSPPNSPSVDGLGHIGLEPSHFKSLALVSAQPVDKAGNGDEANGGREDGGRANTCPPFLQLNFNTII